MKIVAFNCSPRKEQTTQYMLNKAVEEIKKSHPAIEVEVVELAGKKISGCVACGKCYKELACSIDDDYTAIRDILADEAVKGMIIATPVYMGSMTSQCKAMLDRTVMFRRNGFLFRDMIGGVLAIGGSRNGGQEITIQSVQAAMQIHDMIVVGDGDKTSHFGGIMYSKDGVENDDPGLQTVVNLARRVAGLVEKLN